MLDIKIKVIKKTNLVVTDQLLIFSGGNFGLDDCSEIWERKGKVLKGLMVKVVLNITYLSLMLSDGDIMIT